MAAAAGAGPINGINFLLSILTLIKFWNKKKTNPKQRRDNKSSILNELREVCARRRWWWGCGWFEACCSLIFRAIRLIGRLRIRCSVLARGTNVCDQVPDNQNSGRASSTLGTYTSNKWSNNEVRALRGSWETRVDPKHWHKYRFRQLTSSEVWPLRPPPPPNTGCLYLHTFNPRLGSGCSATDVECSALLLSVASFVFTSCCLMYIVHYVFFTRSLSLSLHLACFCSFFAGCACCFIFFLDICTFCG